MSIHGVSGGLTPEQAQIKAAILPHLATLMGKDVKDLTEKKGVNELVKKIVDVCNNPKLLAAIQSTPKEMEKYLTACVKEKYANSWIKRNTVLLALKVILPLDNAKMKEVTQILQKANAILNVGPKALPAAPPSPLAPQPAAPAAARVQASTPTAAPAATATPAHLPSPSQPTATPSRPVTPPSQTAAPSRPATPEPPSPSSASSAPKAATRPKSTSAPSTPAASVPKTAKELEVQIAAIVRERAPLNATLNDLNSNVRSLSIEKEKIFSQISTLTNDISRKGVATAPEQAQLQRLSKTFASFNEQLSKVEAQVETTKTALKKNHNDYQALISQQFRPKTK